MVRGWKTVGRDFKVVGRKGRWTEEADTGDFCKENPCLICNYKGFCHCMSTNEVSYSTGRLGRFTCY